MAERRGEVLEIATDEPARDAPVLEEQHALRAARDVEVVRHDDQGEPVRVEAGEVPQHLLPRDAVEVAGGLVRK